MEWVFIVLIVLAVITILLVFPIFFSVSIYINAKENMGVVMLTLWGLTVMCFQIKLKKTAITIIKRKGKEKEIPINPIDKKVLFMEYFAKSIFKYIIITNITVFFTVGKTNDAFVPSMVGGTVLELLYGLLGVLYTKKGDIPAFVGIETLTDEDALKILNKSSIVFNLFIIMAGLIRAKRLTKRWLYIYERISRQER